MALARFNRLRGAGFLLFLCLGCGGAARADTLTITSTPDRATVEIDGVEAGVTPLELKFPGGYFHKPHWVYSSRLEHPMVARISARGYAPKEVAMTEGPFRYVTYNGVYHGDYYLLKTGHLHVDLEPITNVFDGKVETATLLDTAAPANQDLSVEDLVARATPAVVRIKGDQVSGTGFFVTETGLIVTNKHVVTGNNNLVAEVSSGAGLPAKVVYVEPGLDIALLKVEGNSFPKLPLAPLASVRKGETVIAIGNPGHGMPDSVSRGIVSGIGSHPDKLPGAKGTWIQTDAAINHGNSGGPLLNLRGQVVGMNTLIAFEEAADGKGETSLVRLPGMNFALSAEDLIHVLAQFYPELSSAAAPKQTGSAETAVLEVVSEPSGAEIYLDSVFSGSTPSTLKVAAGRHHIRVSLAGRRDWERDLEAASGSQIRVDAALLPQP